MTTPSDLGRFVREIMRACSGSSSLLFSQGMARQMLQEGMAMDSAAFGGIPAFQGLGVWRVRGDRLYALSLGYNTPGASCWVVCMPECGKGLVVMTNGQKGFDLSPKIVGAVILSHFWPLHALK